MKAQEVNWCPISKLRGSWKARWCSQNTSNGGGCCCYCAAVAAGNDTPNLVGGRVLASHGAGHSSAPITFSQDMTTVGCHQNRDKGRLGMPLREGASGDYDGLPLKPKVPNHSQ